MRRLSVVISDHNCNSVRNNRNSELLGVSLGAQAVNGNTGSAYQVADTNSKPHIGFGGHMDSGKLKAWLTQSQYWKTQRVFTVTISLVRLLLLGLFVP